MGGKAFIVQARDRRLLSELSVLRIADREQLMRIAPFTSASRAKRRLAQLTEAGLLRRYFIGTPVGGSKALYTLSTRGAATVSIDARPVLRKRDAFLASDPFVEHQLLLNEIYLALKTSTVGVAGYRFRSWQSFSGKIASAIELIPDGYFEIDSPKGVRSAFVEVDCGTESLRVWKKKAAQYLRLASSGAYKERFGNDGFLVLIVVPSERRLKSIASELYKSSGRIFRLSTFQDIKDEGFWSAVWHAPGGDQKLPLIERHV